MITIVDYGAGNLRSIERALARLGADSRITGSPDHIREAEAIVFPGVGNARAAMDQLHATGIAGALTAAAEGGTPLLGVCLGMQLLFGPQEEGPTEGLHLLAGRGVRLPGGLKAPHMGWNTVRYAEHGPFGGRSDEIMYFVHSYVVEPDDPADIAGQTDYGITFPSVVARDNVWGTQFHPEKSGDAGIALLERWLITSRTVSTR